MKRTVDCCMCLEHHACAITPLAAHDTLTCVCVCVFVCSGESSIHACPSFPFPSCELMGRCFCGAYAWTPSIWFLIIRLVVESEPPSGTPSLAPPSTNQYNMHALRFFASSTSPSAGVSSILNNSKEATSNTLLMFKFALALVS